MHRRCLGYCVKVHIKSRKNSARDIPRVLTQMQYGELSYTVNRSDTILTRDPGNRIERGPADQVASFVEKTGNLRLAMIYGNQIDRNAHWS